MKKVVCSLFALVLGITVIFSGVTTVAYAGAYEDECDLVFRKALEEILVEENIAAPTIETVKTPIYDLELDQLGFLYEMKYDKSEGFALVINTDGNFGVSEFYMEGVNPYEGYTGQYVYAAQSLYLIWQDEHYVEAESGGILDDSAIATLSDKAFSSSYVITNGTDVIRYTNRTYNTFELVKRHPAYFPSGLSNACVPAAGANVIGYWTRYYPELMPGFTPGNVQFGQYLYLETSSLVHPFIEDLYYAMGTNVDGAGTSVPQFKSGMTSYVNGKGRAISYSSTMTNGSFNYSLAKQKLENGTPLVLFVDGFKVDTFQQGTNQVSVGYSVSSTCHAMAGFGYNEITYTLTNGSVRTDTYIQVASGIIDRSKGYYNIYYNTQIDECLAINIS